MEMLNSNNFTEDADITDLPTKQWSHYAHSKTRNLLSESIAYPELNNESIINSTSSEFYRSNYYTSALLFDSATNAMNGRWWEFWTLEFWDINNWDIKTWIMTISVLCFVLCIMSVVICCVCKKCNKSNNNNQEKDIDGIQKDELDPMIETAQTKEHNSNDVKEQQITASTQHQKVPTNSVVFEMDDNHEFSKESNMSTQVISSTIELIENSERKESELKTREESDSMESMYKSGQSEHVTPTDQPQQCHYNYIPVHLISNTKTPYSPCLPDEGVSSSIVPQQYRQQSKPKSEWDVQEVSDWVGLLGQQYKKYIHNFINHGINGRLLCYYGDDEGKLKDIFGKAISDEDHRNKVMLDWMALS